MAEIEAEARERTVAKADVVRQRLERKPRRGRQQTSLHKIADLIGSIDDLPKDMAGRKKAYLRKMTGTRAGRATGYGQKRSG